jgi:hypothetical protein
MKFDGTFGMFASPGGGAMKAARVEAPADAGGDEPVAPGVGDAVAAGGGAEGAGDVVVAAISVVVTDGFVCTAWLVL